MGALPRLIESVENGLLWYEWLNHEPALPDGMMTVARDAYHGSLDAALALHAALLPGWIWSVKETIDGHAATVEMPIGVAQARAVDFDNTARAWLLAILRAKAGGA